jgi:uncharacterized membrane protein YfcA
MSLGAFDLHTFFLFALSLSGAGVLAGLLAGLLGVGGGIVIVPVLYHLMLAVGFDADLTMHVAVGTSLAAIVPTSIMSARSHDRRGAVDRELLRLIGPGIFVGSIIGVLVAAVARGWVLSLVFGVVALAVSIHMTFTPEGFRLAEKLPSRPVTRVIGAVIGFFSSLMGIGGGTLTVPVLSLHNYPIRRAVGTSSACGLIISLPGAIGFAVTGFGRPDLPPLSLGYVSLLGILMIVPSTLLMSPVGARLAHTIPPRALRFAFALFLFVTAVRMLVNTFG